MFKGIGSTKTDNDLRVNAFEEFKRIASLEQANGVETLSLFRLVRVFSTATKSETDQTVVCMRYWSRKGDSAALIQHGTELYHGGYDPTMYDTGHAPKHDFPT
jgi:hypothetical protein